MSDDELDRRLRDLVDDVDRVVVLSSAHEARARGARLRSRTRVAVGTAVLVCVAATAASFTWAADPDHGATRVTPANSPTPLFNWCLYERWPSASASPSFLMPTFPVTPKPTLSSASATPQLPSSPPQLPTFTPPSPTSTATTAHPPTMVSLPSGTPLNFPVGSCLTPAPVDPTPSPSGLATPTQGR